MKLSSLFRRSRSGSASPVSTLEVTDSLGRQLSVSEREWRTKVLPRALRDQWNDPEQLYTTLFDALGRGWHAEVLDAARHFASIDSDGSRGVCIYAVALIESGRPYDAENILLEYLGRAGENGHALSALAKAYRAQGKEDQADETLLRGLQVDPNQEQGTIALYASRLRERRGPQAEIEGMRRVAAVAGSWRPQLWLARLALEAGQLEHGVSLYREALLNAGKPVPAELLLQMSGDLGLKGHSTTSLELTRPHFDVAAHGIQVGNNLIKSLLAVGDSAAARAILRDLHNCQRPDWAQILDHWEQQLSKAEQAVASASRSTE